MRKLICTILTVVIYITSFAQNPYCFNYQSVVRDMGGDLVANQIINFRFFIMENTSTGTIVYSETQLTNSNSFGVCNLKIGEGSDASGSLLDLDWGASSYYLNVAIDINGTTSFVDMGTIELLSVPYALYAKNAGEIDKDVLHFPESDTLFAVKDYNGNIVFAVFPDGAKVYINEGVKGRIGGFAVTGRNPEKVVNEEDYILVTPDSTRVWVNEDIKSRVGGFAVTGRNPGKEETNSFMNITKENYFIGHSSGKNLSLGQYNSFFGYNAGQNIKSGFSNIFIGYESGYSADTAHYNVFIGDMAGRSNTKGILNVFIGSNAGFSNTTGRDNCFIGNFSGYNNTEGESNSFYGITSGQNNLTGRYNTFLGASSGYSNIDGNFNFSGGYGSFYNFESGESNVAIGANAAFSVKTGNSNVYIGTSSAHDKKSGDNNVFVGQGSGISNEFGENNVFIGAEAGWSGLGDNNVFIGYRAGYYEDGSNKLHISNINTNYPLIYGEFDNQLLKINGTLDMSDQPSKPKIYKQVSEPDIPDNTQAFWVDTDDSDRYYLILDVDGVQKKLELL